MDADDQINKTDKPAPKVAKEIKALNKNPLPDNTEVAEYIRRRRTQ